MVFLNNLVLQVSLQKDSVVRDLFKHPRPEVRWAAAWVTGNKGLAYHDDLVALLTDDDGYVRMAARRGLILLSLQFERRRTAAGQVVVRITRAVDWGPAPLDGPDGRKEAARRWREWWSANQPAPPEQSATSLPDPSLDDPFSDAWAATTTRGTYSPETETQADAAARLGARLLLVKGRDRDEVLGKLTETKGPEYTAALVEAIPRLSGDARRQARDALAERMAHMTAATLRTKFHDDNVEVRWAAVLACARAQETACVPQLIPLLDDAEPPVARAAHAALKRLTGQDFGPDPDATRTERAAAMRTWQAWWDRQHPP